MIARAGRLSVVSLCSSRELRLETGDVRDVSAMTFDAATGRLLLGGDAADGSHRLWTLQMADGARAQPVTFDGEQPVPGVRDGEVRVFRPEHRLVLGDLCKFVYMIGWV